MLLTIVTLFSEQRYIFTGEAHSETVVHRSCYQAGHHPADGSSLSLKKEHRHIPRKSAVTRRSVKCRLLSSPFDGRAHPFSNDIIALAGTFPGTRDEAQHMEFVEDPVL